MTDHDPAPEATATTPTQEEGTTPTLSHADALAALEAARKEAASYRTKLKAAQDATTAAQTAAERAKLDEIERIKAERADAESKAAAAEARATAAERRATLTGKVADPTAALKLLDEAKHVNEDGTVDPEKLLADYPVLKPTNGLTAIGGANPRGQKDPSQMSDEEYFRNRTSTK